MARRSRAQVPQILSGEPAQRARSQSVCTSAPPDLSRAGRVKAPTTTGNDPATERDGTSPGGGGGRPQSAPTAPSGVRRLVMMVAPGRPHWCRPAYSFWCISSARLVMVYCTTPLPPNTANLAPESAATSAERLKTGKRYTAGRGGSAVGGPRAGPVVVGRNTNTATSGFLQTW